MNCYKFVLAIMLMLSGIRPAVAQGRMEYLRSWVGKSPVSVTGEARRNIYRTSKLRRKLLKLLGNKNYDRLLQDYHVMGAVELVENYIIVDRCERANCDESSSFMAVNLSTDDVHVAFYKLGRVEWFHSKGRTANLPQAVLRKVWWIRDNIRIINAK